MATQPAAPNAAAADGYMVSARKYRPGTFEDVVGQEHVTNTLRNGVRTGQLGHAFLFCGPRGVGKTTCARILAKAVNCQNLTESGDPCNECASCKGFNEGHSLNIFELDAASNNSVDDIRALIEQLRYVPQGGQRSVYIIDEVHMLSTQAFNAFLKTLEEPPEHAIFILATTEKHKILPTILSRCQQFDFKRIKVEEISSRLSYIAEQEGIAYEADALHLIAHKADGGLRDALSIFDQLANFSGRNVSYQVVLENLNVLDAEVYFRVVDSMQTQDHASLLLQLDGILDKGFDAAHFLEGLCSHFRDLLVAREATTESLLEVTESVRARYVEQGKSLPASLLLNALNLTSEAEQRLRTTANTRLLVELTLMKLAHLSRALEVAALQASEKKKA